jgi:hypothetical protein
MFATTLRQSAAVLAVAAFAVAPSWAQGRDTQTRVQVLPEDQERTASELHAYEALVTAYLARDTTATQTILEWTPERLGVALGLVSGPGRGPRRGTRAGSRRPPSCTPTRRSRE